MPPLPTRASTRWPAKTAPGASCSIAANVHHVPPAIGASRARPGVGLPAMRRLVAAVVALALLGGTAASAAAQAPPNLKIRRTNHGIPHIKAQGFFGLGYGYGYAFAQD